MWKKIALVSTVLEEEELKIIHANIISIFRILEMSSSKNKIHFKVSAPGKVTLFGEHAHIYDNKTIVAASIDMRTAIAFAETDDSSGYVMGINFPGIDVNINITSLKKNFYDFHNKEKKMDKNAIMEKLGDKIFMTWSEYPRIKKIYFKILFYLFTHITFDEQINLKSFNLSVSSILPNNEGLGTTVSIAVCLAACFLHWSRLQKDIGTGDTFDDVSLEKIWKYAKECEEFIYDYDTSKIDSAICTYGSIIEYQQGQPMKILNDIIGIKVLLIDTRFNNTASSEMEKMNKVKQWFPEILAFIIQGIESISKLAVEALNLIRVTNARGTSVDNTKFLKAQFEKLDDLIQMNHKFIRTLDVSNKELNSIFLIAQNFGLKGKYTDGERGRYAYILLHPDTTDETVQILRRELVAITYDTTIVSLGCGGVKIEFSV